MLLMLWPMDRCYGSLKRFIYMYSHVHVILNWHSYDISAIFWGVVQVQSGTVKRIAVLVSIHNTKVYLIGIVQSVQFLIVF